MRVRRTVVEAIEAHARRDHPHECCGLLIGTAGEIAEAVPTGNVAADPRRRYEVSPVEHLAQIRRCRESGARGARQMDVVGVYHSHPNSAPEASPTDLDQAFEQFLYIIVGPIAPETPVTFRGYRLRAGQLQPVALTIS